MTYDNPKPYMDVGIKIVNIWFRISGEIYGDRAIFVRSKVLQQCISALNVPLFEDVQLAKCLQKRGRIVMLKDKVTTSTEPFQTYGLIGNMGRFLTSRIWYSLGGSPHQIYRAYYKKEPD